jgi:hypothetical protein
MFSKLAPKRNSIMRHLIAAVCLMASAGFMTFTLAANAQGNPCWTYGMCVAKCNRTNPTPERRELCVRTHPCSQYPKKAPASCSRR